MKRTFIKNAAILTATSLLLRTVGIFFRVYLAGKIGAEGMGLYQLVFSIYILGATFATSGIITAVTRLVTDDLVCGTRQSVLRILRRSVTLSILIGIASAVIIYFTADAISLFWIKDVRAAPALKILTISLPFMGAASCFKGYFFARRKAGMPSLAQILEQTVRIGVIIAAIDRFAAQGLAAACAAVMLADTVAEAASCVFLWLLSLHDKRKLRDLQGKNPAERTLSRLLAIAAPITAGRYLGTALRTVENILVPDCLFRYMRSREKALSSFGALKGMAMPLLFFPAAFLTALSTLLIPEISEATALGQQGRVHAAVQRSLHITLLSSALLSGIFTVYARPLGLLMYKSEEVGFLLQVLAPLMPIMYLESIVDGILKGLNQQTSSLKYSVADSVVRIVLIFLLVPRMGMQGFLLVMVVSNILTSFLNLHRLLKVTQLRLCWYRWIIGPALAVGASGLAAYFLGELPAMRQLPLLASSIIGAGVICLLYGVLVLLLGCVTKEELLAAKRLKAGT